MRSITSRRTYMHAPVTASAGLRSEAGPQSGGLEAVAVVEPLRRVAVAHGPAELDAPVGVLQLRADDADVLVLVSRVLKTLKPARQRLDVGVQHDDVAVGFARAHAAVRVCGEARVLLRRDEHVDALDLSQRGEVLRAAAIVGDDDAKHPPRDGL